MIFYDFLTVYSPIRLVDRKDASASWIVSFQLHCADKKLLDRFKDESMCIIKFNELQLEEVIGIGGFGKVYRGF